MHNAMLPMHHAMSRKSPITPKNLKRLAYLNGFDGVSGLAASIGRSRVTLWRALRNPTRYRPTVLALQKRLVRTTHE